MHSALFVQSCFITKYTHFKSKQTISKGTQKSNDINNIVGVLISFISIIFVSSLFR